MKRRNISKWQAVEVWGNVIVAMKHGTSGKNCSAPIDDICMSLGNASDFLVEQGFARRASVEELLVTLKKGRGFGVGSCWRQCPGPDDLHLQLLWLLLRFT